MSESNQYSSITVYYIPVSLIMIRRKNALFAHFHGKLAKLKIFHAKCHLLFNFNFLNTKNISKKFKKKFKKIIKNNKVVTAITDICTGGQQCKYLLLGSGVNTCISYYLHGGDFCCYCSKKIWRNADITLKFCTHIHLGIMKEQSVFATRNMLYLPS